MRDTRELKIALRLLLCIIVFVGTCFYVGLTSHDWFAVIAVVLAYRAGIEIGGLVNER